MQDPSDLMEIAEPEENGQSNTADSPVVDDPTPNSDIDLTTASTVLAEVLPGVAVVFGEVPAELKLDLIDFGLVSAADRQADLLFRDVLSPDRREPHRRASGFAGMLLE